MKTIRMAIPRFGREISSSFGTQQHLVWLALRCESLAIRRLKQNQPMDTVLYDNGNLSMSPKPYFGAQTMKATNSPRPSFGTRGGAIISYGTSEHPGEGSGWRTPACHRPLPPGVRPVMSSQYGRGSPILNLLIPCVWLRRVCAATTAW